MSHLCIECIWKLFKNDSSNSDMVDVIDTVTRISGGFSCTEGEGTQIYSTFLSYFNLTATHTFRRQRKYVKVTNTRFFLPFCLGSYSTISSLLCAVTYFPERERTAVGQLVISQIHIYHTSYKMVNLHPTKLFSNITIQ